MWEFKRGNPNALEGKACIYVRNRMLHTHGSDKGSIEYPVFRVASSPLDLILPGEHIGNYESIRQEEEKLRKSLNGKGDEPQIGVIRPFAIKDLSVLSEIPGDIIFTGNVPCESIGHQILMGASQMYHTDYLDQLSGRIGRGNGKSEIPRIDINALDEMGLVEKLSTLVCDLYGSRESGDTKREVRTRAQLLQIAERTRISQNVGQIVDAFVSNHPNKERIIELEIRLAGYIHAEKYREAVDVKRELEALIRK